MKKTAIVVLLSIICLVIYSDDKVLSIVQAEIESAIATESNIFFKKFVKEGFDENRFKSEKELIRKLVFSEPVLDFVDDRNIFMSYLYLKFDDALFYKEFTTVW